MTEGFKKVGIIDTYELETGTYLFSRRVPKRCSWMAFSEGFLYTAVDATISKWALDS